MKYITLPEAFLKVTGLNYREVTKSKDIPSRRRAMKILGIRGGGRGTCQKVPLITVDRRKRALLEVWKDYLTPRQYDKARGVAGGNPSFPATGQAYTANRVPSHILERIKSAGIVPESIATLDELLQIFGDLKVMTEEEVNKRASIFLSKVLSTRQIGDTRMVLTSDFLEKLPAIWGEMEALQAPTLAGESVKQLPTPPDDSAILAKVETLVDKAVQEKLSKFRAQLSEILMSLTDGKSAKVEVDDEKLKEWLKQQEAESDKLNGRVEINSHGDLKIS